MAITSLFYTGPVTGANWGDGQLGVGERYWVADSEAAKVIPVASATRTVRVQAGRIAGGGVHDDITEHEDIPLPNPAAGTVYFTIVARRVWQTTNATTLTYEEGTTARAIAAGLNKIPGTIDDQPLAIVAVTANNPTVSVVDDLRCIGTKGDYEASSDLVLSYMTFPGYRIRISGTTWLRTMGSTWERVSGSRSGRFADFAPAYLGSRTSTTRYFGKAIPSKPFERVTFVQVFANIDVAPSAKWGLYVELADTSTPTEYGNGVTYASQLLWGEADGGMRSASITVMANISANEEKSWRAWLVKQSGDGISIEDTGGFAYRIDWVETTPGNDW